MFLKLKDVRGMIDLKLDSTSVEPCVFLPAVHPCTQCHGPGVGCGEWVGVSFFLEFVSLGTGRTTYKVDGDPSS